MVIYLCNKSRRKISIGEIKMYINNNTITIPWKEYEKLLTHSVQLEAVMATYLTKEQQNIVNDLLEMQIGERIYIDDPLPTAEEVLAEYEELQQTLRERGYIKEKVLSH